MRRLLFITIIVLLIGTPATAAGLTVFAASSLREAFIEIGRLHEQRSGQEVIFNFAGSQILRTQIEFGAPADLFAAADPETMHVLTGKGLVEPVHVFAGNELAVLLSGRQSPVDRLADLARPGGHIALGNDAVPIGIYSRQLLEGMAADPAYGEDLVAGIRANVRTEESSAKAIVAKVLLGEVDAGIVYRSDLTPEVLKSCSSLELPRRHQPPVLYPVAVIRGSSRPASAQAFLKLLLAPDGQRILVKYGFLPAPKGEPR